MGYTRARYRAHASYHRIVVDRRPNGYGSLTRKLIKVSCNRLFRQDCVCQPSRRRVCCPHKTMKKCSYCGRENNDTSIVCFECGVELAGPAKIESDPQLTDPDL